VAESADVTDLSKNLSARRETGDAELLKFGEPCNMAILETVGMEGVEEDERLTMAFQDDVRLEIEAGRVPKRFKRAHLKKIRARKPGYYRLGNGEYSTNTINTVPRNLSIRPDGADPGDYVRKGRKPAFLWFGNGEFELCTTGGDIADRDEDQESNEAEVQEEIYTDSVPLARVGAPIVQIVDESSALGKNDPVALG